MNELTGSRGEFPFTRQLLGELDVSLAPYRVEVQDEEANLIRTGGGMDGKAVKF